MIADVVETIPNVKTSESDAIEIELKRRRFSTAEYMRMAEAEFFAENEKVELIRGEIIEMSPVNIPHASTIRRLVQLLAAALGKQVILDVQNPIQLGEESLPQPDVVLLRPRDDAYSQSHPAATDVLLLIEVADTSLRYDRRVKGPLYGAAGIDDYWIINIQARQVEVYREPRQDGYRTVTYYTPGETLSLLAFTDVSLSVDEILGKNG